MQHLKIFFLKFNLDKKNLEKKMMRDIASAYEIIVSNSQFKKIVGFSE